MITKKFFPLGVYVVFLCVALVQIAPTAANGVERQLYTAYNIWYEKPESLWCINYKSGTIIPAWQPAATRPASWRA